ncbi:hypothetical protein Lalb_Chr23g0274011 [Lupinus albus]|uniref:Uncharacterized protein n=1 Tax=Lupinus albus TaxID=3870 RepID=A0A6A4NJ05_LUPAL|nr:hypothetical protein Lalb_Chr23g0274011 [Lupinus albus]
MTILYDDKYVRSCHCDKNDKSIFMKMTKCESLIVMNIYEYVCDNGGGVGYFVRLLRGDLDED